MWSTQQVALPVAHQPPAACAAAPSAAILSRGQALVSTCVSLNRAAAHSAVLLSSGYGRLALVKLLLERGAQLDAVNAKKQKPADVAKLNGEVRGSRAGGCQFLLHSKQSYADAAVY
jgi:hypothetical protein